MRKEALQKLEAMRKQAEINSAENTDTQALEVAALYPEWTSLAEGETLSVGTRLRHKGTLYKVLQEHNKQSGWAPDVTPSLFAKVLIPDASITPAWEQPGSTNGYSVGDRVTHGGKTWESLVDSNVWEPGATGSEALRKEV